MSKSLVIVESPTKIRTLKKYLGPDYDVASTVGHIKDLPTKELGVSIEHGFDPQYTTIQGKEKVIRALKKAASNLNDIYLAQDPDREGEAIAWHTAEVLKKKGRRFYRVLFHELTKNAILTAVASPQQLDKHKFESQQARRILDRLVGYQISPILWQKVLRGLSAGRVQSVAVRIICEREREIHAFQSEEYWSITAKLEGESPPPFLAKLIKKHNKKLRIPDEKASQSILKDLEEARFRVEKVIQKAQKRNPPPPYITSKLQQEAIRKLGFSAKKTMMVAQQLYEGIELGPEEPEGLITYMRTDSIRIAKEAIDEARHLIEKEFGPTYLPTNPNVFKNKKRVQDAHEAIRPTSVLRKPKEIAQFLSKDQLSLYELIWKRFVASQMKPAVFDQTSVAISATSYLFQASGSVIRFPGFMALYTSSDDNQIQQKDKETLPRLSEGMALKCHGLEPKQHFTQPPPRFSEASLVKELEENGIGRPSTYASILTTIRQKGYVDLIKKFFRPSELGFIVNDLLIESFPDILNVDFTARMENNLDKIEEAKIESVSVLEDFYRSFRKDLERATKEMHSVKGNGLPVDMDCPKCGKPLGIKVGKNGPFLACSGYPNCNFTRNYTRDEKGQIEMEQPVSPQATDEICEKCGSPMVQKQGRFGPFVACSAYPACKNTRSLKANATSKTEPTGVKCPEKGCGGELVARRSRRGKLFYGCTGYPACTFAVWDKPVPQSCPECGASFVLKRTTKKDGPHLRCFNKECTYKEPIKENDEAS
ncbi:MAG: DNA topoisomerase I [Desulfobacterales bacterium C00003060]|nr:MAG: DNA topoisomerase I [Desulfobacterales bacterium C00003060]OEU80218.1 MAG: DNA topoisomerase I [Desulfobacterales bacterium S5133MH4]